ncbi:hypothetical protein APV28_4018 [Comamonas testosteroni]|nr:hypothetical protein APV28_4018 [Comamonas testosteroni]
MFKQLGIAGSGAQCGDDLGSTTHLHEMSLSRWNVIGFQFWHECGYMTASCTAMRH